MARSGLRKVTAVTVNFRTPDLAAECVRTLAAQHSDAFDLHIVLADNGSGDGSAARLELLLADLIAQGKVSFLPLEINGGFGWANNQAMLHAFRSEAAPDAIFLINPDCVPEAGALDALVAELERHPQCGVAGSQLLNTDGSLAGSAFRFHTVGTEFVGGLGLPAVGRLLGIKPVLVPYGQAGDVGWVTGAACLLRSAALREAGLFDTGFFLYFEEVELMHRLGRLGWTARHVPQSRIMHIGGASTGVVDGKAVAEKAPPPYWFDSRRRFFALTQGPVRAWAASIAWITGARIGRLLAPIIPGSRIVPTRAEEARMRAQGVRARPSDCEPAIARMDDLPGMQPGWMREAA